MTSTTTTTPNACGLEPLTGCRVAGGAKTALLVRDLPNDGKDQLVMKWVDAPADVAAIRSPPPITRSVSTTGKACCCRRPRPPGGSATASPAGARSGTASSTG